ncbi:alpha/beta hydrolase [Myxococcus llanfairpwllgwyngyllgogerychwyrndrobwllllantysiliogogogochensis]|uniref:Alpha/beta hydrolase n=1 Tax=Myxococcus llanfairpwllgwyngyllgogerychwyrndrobwllllantysiliogogogochensis TaxID=2590453 RepID=A0A540WKL1_9BACT|nr:alpha/beta hydrolase [Myxococcus llanfairpwllgwyngyllgogerychwyrndrobwllllantysiliogogogochensis]TQF09546.1 alpha/beta hydrolase [Myxococcus llanfairpwllgwyngyllgogerychwyrndrobwllllantysiliogogogochensis]
MSATVQKTQTQPDTIVLVHGMWMTPRSWQGWIDRFTKAGYRVIAPSWPGLEVGVEALQKDPTPLENLRVKQIVDHYERIIRALPTPPILMGHSYGGAFVQMLLDRGVGAAGVAIHSAPVKGVYTLPFTTIKSTASTLLNPANVNRPAPMTPEQFHYAFTNTLTQEESDEVYRTQYVPGSGRALFQGALANLTPHSEVTVNLKNDERAPLLFLSGDSDIILPAKIQRENVKRYAKSKAVTEYVELKGRSHYTVAQPGWEAVADLALNWAAQHATVRS